MRLKVSRNLRDDPEAWAPGLLVVDDLLGIVEAAAALRLAVERGIGRLGRTRATARGFAHFLLGDAIAQADDHAPDIALLRRVRN